MLGYYFENDSRRTSSWKKTAFAFVGVVALVALIGSVTMTQKESSSKLLSVLNAEELEFNEYINTYGKVYDHDEYVTRFRKFRDNLAYIRVFNSMENTITLGLNKFADMDFAEFKSKYLSSNIPTKETVNVNNFEGYSAPAAVDWRTKGAVTPVKNEGQCGSCWTFSTTGAIEGAWAIAGHPLVSLSEQQLLDCSTPYGNQGCNGGMADNSFKYVIANKGITTEANYPYTARQGTCNKAKAAQAAATISSFVNVASNNPTALQNAVAQQPVSIVVEADQPAWQLYTSGTVTQNCGTNPNLAVLIVGYDTTASPPFWIIKSSWSAEWGMQGYIQVEITSGKGVCGVNIGPSYPTV